MPASEPSRLPAARWPRLQLVELTDLALLPRPLRRWLGDYLRGVVTLTRFFAPAAPRIAELMRGARTDRVVDLCSGGGGPWPALAEDVARSLGARARVVLTDLHPDPATWAFLRRTSAGAVEGFPSAVPADAVPEELEGVRTIFDGLHHFPPKAARAVLADAARRGIPLVAAEATRRSLLGLLLVLLSPLFVWAVTPLLRPFSASRLLFTYLLPVVPLLALFDGVVSALRCYRPDELLALAEGLPGSHVWSVERPRGARGPTLLVGRRAGGPPHLPPARGGRAR